MTKLEAPSVVKSAKEREKEWLKEEIHFEFFNLEEPGVPLKFSFGPTQNVEKHTLLHGGRYKKSRAVVQHIESRQTPIWNYMPNGSGQMEKSLKGYKSRFQCRQVFE
jgi:hypothetical protein